LRQKGQGLRQLKQGQGGRRIKGREAQGERTDRIAPTDRAQGTTAGKRARAEGGAVQDARFPPAFPHRPNATPISEYCRETHPKEGEHAFYHLLVTPRPGLI